MPINARPASIPAVLVTPPSFTDPAAEPYVNGLHDHIRGQETEITTNCVALRKTRRYRLGFGIAALVLLAACFVMVIGLGSILWFGSPFDTTGARLASTQAQLVAMDAAKTKAENQVTALTGERDTAVRNAEQARTASNAATQSKLESDRKVGELQSKLDDSKATEMSAKIEAESAKAALAGIRSVRPSVTSSPSVIVTPAPAIPATPDAAPAPFLLYSYQPESTLVGNLRRIAGLTKNTKSITALNDAANAFSGTRITLEQQKQIIDQLTAMANTLEHGTNGVQRDVPMLRQTVSLIQNPASRQHVADAH